MAKKKKGGALAASARKRLEAIGNAPMNAAKAAIAMLRAEEAGHAERVTLEDGSWGWVVAGPTGKEQVVVPTAEMLAVVHMLESQRDQ